MSDTRRGGAEIVRVIERTGDPSPEADRVILYAKDVSGVTQLFALASDGSISQVSALSGSAIGGVIGGSPVQGSVLFVGAGGVLAQDDTHLDWSATNTRLLVASSHVTDGPLMVQGLTTTTPSALGAIDNSGGFHSYWGYFNSAYAFTYMRGKNGVLAQDNSNIIFGNSTQGCVEFGMPTDGIFMELARGNTSAVSSANAGRFRYNQATQTMQISNNGAAYVDIGTGSGASIGGAITGGTTGSVLFVGAGATIAQDNANLFWDDTNNRLGIGTASPLYELDLRGPTTAGKIHFSPTTTDDGGYLISAQASQALIAGGSYYDGTNFINKATSTSVMDLVLGGFLFYNGTGLTIGAVGSYTMRMQVYPAGGVEISNSDSATASITGAGKIRYTTTGQKLQISSNAAAYFDIGTYAAALTTGSVPFANASNQLAQDNTNLFWDNTNKRLGIGTATPTWALHVKAAGSGVAAARVETTSTDSYSEWEYCDSSGTFKAGIGYANSTVAITYVRNKVFVYSTGPDIVFANSSQAEFSFGMTHSQAFIELGDGSNSANSGADKGRLIYYDSGVPSLLASYNGSAYFFLMDSATQMTTGSVVFAASGGHLTQDNAHFFWDNTNKRLGIGTTAPADFVHVKASGPAFNCFRAENTSTTGFSSLILIDSAGTFEGGFYYGNSAVASAYLQSKFFIYSNGPDLNLANGTRLEVTFGMTTGSTFVQMQDGVSAAVSDANTGRIRYNNTTHTFQASLNGGAYADLASNTSPSIGGALTGATAGSVLFAGSAVFAQDNADFFWDNTNKKLGIGTASPQDGLHIKLSKSAESLIRLENTSNAGLSVIEFYDNSGGGQILFGYGNPSASGLTYINGPFLYLPSAATLSFGNTTAAEHIMGMIHGSVYYQFGDGASAAVSASGTMRLRYNAGTDKFQVSKNGAAYIDIV